MKEVHMEFQSDGERKARRHEYDRKWYQRHKDRLREKRKQHDADLRLLCAQSKGKLRCMNCGENHPACLQFHHRDKAEKSFTIGAMRLPSKKRFLAEIQKCDVLCVNCHAKLHWKEIHGTDEDGGAILIDQ